jgi:succinoglycan biosynthesis transport protein ExoP
MNEHNVFNIDPYLDLVYSKRKWIIRALSIGVALTLAAVLLLPRSFTSSVVIASSPAEVTTQASTRTSIDFKTRVEALEHEVLSAPSLGRVIHAYGLYSREVQMGVSTEDLANYMRKRIVVGVTADDDYNKSHGGTVSITFRHSDPLTVQHVTQKLADLFVQQDWAEEDERAATAVRFFADQLAHSEIELDAKTNEIKALKNNFQGSLPEDLEANLRAQANLQAELEQSSESHSILEERQMQLGRSLAGSMQQGVTIRSPSGQMTWSSPQEALTALETQLTVLRATYSDQYPDVVQLKAEIEALKKRFGDMKDQTSQPLAVTPLNAELAKQRDAISVESTRLDARLREVQKQISDYQQRIEETPIHEQQLAVLTRDESVLTAQYQDLLQKELAAKIYQNLVARHEGESLQVIEPALRPKGSGSPRGATILAVGLILSVITALGTGFGLSLLDNSIKTVNDLRSCNLQMAVTIPMIDEIEGSRDRFLSNMRTLTVSCSCLAVGLGMLWLYSRAVS